MLEESENGKYQRKYSFDQQYWIQVNDMLFGTIKKYKSMDKSYKYIEGQKIPNDR